MLALTSCGGPSTNGSNTIFIPSIDNSVDLSEYNEEERLIPFNHQLI